MTGSAKAPNRPSLSWYFYTIVCPSRHLCFHAFVCAPLLLAWMFYNIHKTAVEYQKNGEYDKAEKTYREALLTYPNMSGMILGLAGTLALKGDTEEAIELTERGLPLSANEKQKATLRAALCFLYLKAGREDKAVRLAAELPHTRESREVILPLVQQGLSSSRIDENIRTILLGD